MISFAHKVISRGVAHVLIARAMILLGRYFYTPPPTGGIGKPIAGVYTLPSVEAPHSRVAFKLFKPNTFVDEPDLLTPNKILLCY